MSLPEFWFLLIAVLFSGYFMLEGFDFGVGALLPLLGGDDPVRRVMINTVGPVWEANQTWLIVAAASMFAAFPRWYATVFSAFYLPLLVILAAIITRGLAFEFRGKVDDAAWRRRWDAALIVGSVALPVLWGVVFANLVRGIPLNADGDFTGSLADLLHPYALLSGVAFLLLFGCHGAIFIALRTKGRIRQDARRFAGFAGPITFLVVAAFALWTGFGYGDLASQLFALVAVVSLTAALLANRAERERLAFASTCAAVVTVCATVFSALERELVRAVNDPSLSITIERASSAPVTLRAMTWVAALALPFVIAAQVWGYWMFRARIGRGNIPLTVPHGAGRTPVS
jgi:cytochrome d ubiquinol oxidase subunit II